MLSQTTERVKAFGNPWKPASTSPQFEDSVSKLSWFLIVNFIARQSHCIVDIYSKNWSFLCVRDVSFNNLEGEIPFGLPPNATHM